MMSSEKISLVFFGSGPVAAESLKLLSAEFEIEAVVTKSTTEEQMRSSCPGVQVYCVSDKQSTDELFTTKNFKSELGVLIDFGIIVSNKVIEAFEFGVVNSHFSLLPELRGADPISFAILEGKDRTGVSLMLLVEAMDEGPILSIGEHELGGGETTEQLTKSLVQLSNSLLSDCLPGYLSGEIKPAPQEYIAKKFNRTASYTRKLTKTDGILDWQKTATQLEREVRAFQTWPKSRTELKGLDCIITKASVGDKSGESGTLYLGDGKLGVYCKAGLLIIEELKPAGKPAMTADAFLAGYRARLE